MQYLKLHPPVTMSWLLQNIFLTCLALTSAHCWSGNIVFQDEFNGNSLNQTKWEYQVGCTGYGQSDLECYTRDKSNVQVGNGKLTITAQIKKTSSDGKSYDYTSGRIRQKGEGFVYGAYVMRAKLPDGKHLWPAFWTLMETDCKYEEIDIMEYRGQRKKENEVTPHYGRRYDALESDNGTLAKLPFDLSADFHEFAVLWVPQKIEWYVDNVKVHQVSLEPSKWRRDPNKIPCGDVIQPFAEKTFILLNMAVGGSFFQGYGTLTVEEARKWAKPTYEIDWVRIYQDG